MICWVILRVKMFKFYLFLWIRWAFFLTLRSFVFGLLFSSFVTAIIYYKQGLPHINHEVLLALFDILLFWFSILGNVALLLSLFIGIKSVFNRCYNGFVLELYSCADEGEVELIENVGYGDLVKVWRKWFMLLIWLVAAQMILAVAFSAIFSLGESIFSWFNIYVLYGFIIVAGFFSFIVLGARCKRVRISKC